jgi:Asp/Glu/hydantoin racemase
VARLAIIHTTSATVDPLKALAVELLPGCEVINFVDDSILPQLARNGANLGEVEERLLSYARYAQQVGADVILEACSSVGELVSKMRNEVTIPVVRIDEAMAELAVQRGNRVGAAATLATTLGPTKRLLEEKGRASGKPVEIIPLLVEGAYQRLMSGDREGHDALLVEALSALSGRTDVIVLAQASMARVIARLPAGMQDKFLSSPLLAMEQVRRVLV